MRIRRGQLHGVKVGREWRVYLDTTAVPNEPNIGEQPEQNRTNRTESRSSEAERIVTRQDAEIAFLRGRVEELTALLSREQELRLRETLPAQLATPIETTQASAWPPESAFSAPVSPPPTDTSSPTPQVIKALVKDAGVKGRKARRRLVDQLRGLLGR